MYTQQCNKNCVMKAPVGYAVYDPRQTAKEVNAREVPHLTCEIYGGININTNHAEQ